MEKISAEDKIAAVTVLTEGQKLANELKRQLHSPTLDELKKRQMCDSLLKQILSHYKKAIGILDLGYGAAGEGLDHSSMDQPHVHFSKKRKTLPKRSEQMRVGTGFEDQLDDGYNWRKYGQKVILGANHPRAYYRCTHRHTQGCLATKLVQRTDDDASLFEVSYRGKHSCIQERNKLHKGNAKKEETIQLRDKPKNNQGSIKREDNDTLASSFPSTPMKHDSMETLFTTSDSYLSPSQCEVNDFYGLPALDNDYGEIVSNVTPIPDIRLEEWDFSIDEVDFNLSQFLDAMK